MGIVPLTAGGWDFDHWALYRAGLTNGTDPSHPEYWGDIFDKDQRQVELAAIGLALRLARPQVWDPLNAATKLRVAAYLRSGRDHEFVDSNWKFFRVMIDLGLTHCGIAALRSMTMDGMLIWTTSMALPWTMAGIAAGRSAVPIIIFRSPFIITG